MSLLFGSKTRKIAGTFCEKTAEPKRSFDSASFRWVERGSNWLLMGCHKGSWNKRSQRCKVGTRAHKILVATKTKCKRGEIRVKKG